MVWCPGALEGCLTRSLEALAEPWALKAVRQVPMHLEGALARMGWGCPWMVLPPQYVGLGRVRPRGTEHHSEIRMVGETVHLQVGPVASSPPP